MFSRLRIIMLLSAFIRENVSVMSVGLSVTVIVPSAFVALSQGALRELSAPARLRIASAGAFHNLLLFLLFSALARTPLLSLPGYRDVSAWGRVVSRIQPVSPLFRLLPRSVQHRVVGIAAGGAHPCGIDNHQDRRRATVQRRRRSPQRSGLRRVDLTPVTPRYENQCRGKMARVVR